MNELTEVKRIAWSHNGEDFQADCLQEAIEWFGDLEDLHEGQIFYFGEVDEPNTNWIDTDDIIDMISNRAYDVGGEHAEGFPDVKGQGMSELKTFLKKWQSDYCQPHFYSVKNVQEYALKVEDIIEALK